ncbi:hypothetical protein ACCO45_009894 [Purpureocillium lilacinum]|uniref:Uncharacterized protein n=1 Tax=Purpureocillium lilacinum TaxID=33203 RepID=A0ACC4DHI9_PURLI
MSVSPTMQPPPDGLYPSIDQLLHVCKVTAASEGYSIIKMRTSNYRDGQPTRYDLACSRHGLRRHNTEEAVCPFRAKAVPAAQARSQQEVSLPEKSRGLQSHFPEATREPLLQALQAAVFKMGRQIANLEEGLLLLQSVRTPLSEDGPDMAWHQPTATWDDPLSTAHRVDCSPYGRSDVGIFPI